MTRLLTNPTFPLLWSSFLRRGRRCTRTKQARRLATVYGTWLLRTCEGDSVLLSGQNWLVGGERSCEGELPLSKALMFIEKGARQATATELQHSFVPAVITPRCVTPLSATHLHWRQRLMKHLAVRLSDYDDPTELQIELAMDATKNAMYALVPAEVLEAYKATNIPLPCAIENIGFEQPSPFPATLQEWFDFATRATASEEDGVRLRGLPVGQSPPKSKNVAYVLYGPGERNGRVFTRWTDCFSHNNGGHGTHTKAFESIHEALLSLQWYKMGHLSTPVISSKPQKKIPLTSKSAPPNRLTKEPPPNRLTRRRSPPSPVASLYADSSSDEGSAWTGSAKGSFQESPTAHHPAQGVRPSSNGSFLMPSLASSTTHHISGNRSSHCYPGLHLEDSISRLSLGDSTVKPKFSADNSASATTKPTSASSRSVHHASQRYAPSTIARGHSASSTNISISKCPMVIQQSHAVGPFYIVVSGAFPGVYHSDDEAIAALIQDKDGNFHGEIQRAESFELAYYAFSRLFMLKKIRVLS
ncbi:hypothetical protein DL96DRAFT_1560944 [Flagelloscypha sp. PMI_526]|nr:hypothetical protein DL96DRAFT_1560944 [Flagelloscypha sp. PMI_526]